METDDSRERPAPFWPRWPNIWWRTPLPDKNRGGFPFMAGSLTVTSLPLRTRPAKSGAWLLETVFNRPPQAPKIAFVLENEETRPLPSLELSCNDFTDNKETRYYECVSWVGPGYAANVEKDPRAVFRRLFGGGGEVASRSVLDVIREDARALQARLGRSDQEKLDEYLDSVRATERRIQLAAKAAARIGRPPLAEPAGIPEMRGDYLRLMADLFVIAFQLDLTRVASLVIDPERWDSPRWFHGVFDKPQNHHVLTHTKTAEAAEAITKIDRFHVQFFAEVVGKMKSIREGEGTLLDSCMLAMGSGISDGGEHRYSNLEILLAGKAGGALKPAGHLRIDGDRPLADLWLTLAQTAGVEGPRFADSKGLLKEILV